jgi:hypothetical protein
VVSWFAVAAAGFGLCAATMQGELARGVGDEASPWLLVSTCSREAARAGCAPDLAVTFGTPVGKIRFAFDF